MSNIKLKDHNWAAEGIYDTNQSKSQQTINSDVSTKIGQATLQTSSQNLSGATNELKGRADTLDSKYDNVVTVANTQPSSEYNKVWLPLTVSEGTQVPTWAEHQALDSAITSIVNRFPTTTFGSVAALVTAITATPNLTVGMCSGDGNLAQALGGANGQCAIIYKYISSASAINFTCYTYSGETFGRINTSNNSVIVYYSTDDTQKMFSAYVENGDTASQAYGAGGYIVWKGQFCRVTTLINKNDQFTPNTNIKLTTVGSELYHTQNEQYEQNLTLTDGGTLIMKRKGSVINYEVNKANLAAVQSRNTSGIQDNLKPFSRVMIPLYIADNMTFVGYASISDTGVVTMVNRYGNAQNPTAVSGGLIYGTTSSAAKVV